MNLVSARNPFYPVSVRIAEQEVKAEKAPPDPPVPWTPETLGLHVSSTVVGLRRSVALINGRTYAVGDRFEISKDGRQLELTIIGVQPNRVILEAGPDRFELAIPERQSSGRIDLVGSQN